MSTPIERLLRFAEPMRSHSSSTTITFEWRSMQVSVARVLRCAGSRRGSGRGGRLRAAAAPGACAARASSPPRASRGSGAAVTRTISGPSASARRAASASPMRLRREVLVLDVDVAARRARSCRGRAARRRASPECSPTGGAVQAMPTSTSVTSALELAGHGSPRVAATGRSRCPVATRQRSRASAPSLARGLAVDRDHHVVERRIGLAVGGAARVVGRCSRRVPAPRGQVEPADEREPVVDHDDLLVMASRRAGACRRSGSGRGDARFQVRP